MQTPEPANKRCQDYNSAFYSAIKSTAQTPMCSYSFETPSIRGIHVESTEEGEADEMAGYELKFTSNEQCVADPTKKFQYNFNVLCDRE